MKELTTDQLTKYLMEIFFSAREDNSNRRLKVWFGHNGRWLNLEDNLELFSEKFKHDT